jgi:hypothetical protein
LARIDVGVVLDQSLSIKTQHGLFIAALVYDGLSLSRSTEIQSELMHHTGDFSGVLKYPIPQETLIRFES